jgi:hypothetical protein
MAKAAHIIGAEPAKAAKVFRVFLMGHAIHHDIDGLASLTRTFRFGLQQPEGTAGSLPHSYNENEVAMAVELNSDLEGRISDAVQAGRFETPGQLVEVAVCRLLESLAGPAPADRKRLSLDPPLIPRLVAASI